MTEQTPDEKDKAESIPSPSPGKKKNSKKERSDSTSETKSKVDTSGGQVDKPVVADSSGNTGDGGAAAANNVDPLQVRKVRSSPNEQEETMPTSAASSSTPTTAAAADDIAPEGKAKPKKGNNRRRSFTKKEANDTTTDGTTAAAAAAVNATSASKEKTKKAAESPASSSSNTEHEKTPRKPSKRRLLEEQGADTTGVDAAAEADASVENAGDGANGGGAAAATGVISVSKEQGDATVTSAASVARADGPATEGKAKPKKANARRSSVDKAAAKTTPPIDGGISSVSVSKEDKGNTAEKKSATAAAATASHAGKLPSERKDKQPRKSNRRGSPADQIADDTTITDGVAAAAVVTSKENKEEAEGNKTPAAVVHAAGSPSERIKVKPKNADTSLRSSAEQAAAETGAIGGNVGVEPSKENREGAAKSSRGAVSGTGDLASGRKELTRKGSKRQAPATTQETEGTAPTEDEAAAAATAGVSASKPGKEEENTSISPLAPAARVTVVAPPPGRNEKPGGEVKQTRFDLKTTEAKPTASSGGGRGGGGGGGGGGGAGGGAATGPGGASKEDQEGTAKTLATIASSESSIFDRKTMTRKAKTPSSIVEKRAQRAIADGAVSRPGFGPPGRRPENTAKKLGRRNSAQNVEIGASTAAQNMGEGEGEGGGASVAGASGVTPTPPKKGSNPISSVTPPRTGSRGGNLAVSSSCSSVGEGRASAVVMPTSPRRRPRIHPLFRVRAAEGVENDTATNAADGAERDNEEDGSVLAVLSPSKSRKASDEYVLDESRGKPRGGVFAKIPGLDQRLTLESKKIRDPPNFRAPVLKSGTMRTYAQEEASEAAFRYPECRGVVFRPSYADDGSYQNLPPDSPFLSEPTHKLRLERARGYHGGGFYPPTDNNAFFLGENNMPDLGGPGHGGQKEKAHQKDKKNAGTGTPGGSHKKRNKTGIGNTPGVASKKGFQSKEGSRDGGGGGVSKKAGLGVEEAFRGAGGAGVAHDEFFEVVYPTAALVVMHKFPNGTRETPERQEEEEQEALREEGVRKTAKRRGADVPVKIERFFDGHSDDVTAIAVHPAGVIVASGQVGRQPEVLVWDSSTKCRGKTNTLPKEEATLAVLVGHQNKICCLDFSHDGWLLCSVGADSKSTVNVWDWKKGVAIVTVQAGPGPINAFRFNPYQAYGVPAEEPLPGQAPHIDDSCYCLVSIGVRHGKFWLLMRGWEDETSPKEQRPPALPGTKALSQRKGGDAPAGGGRTIKWLMDGSSARLNGKGESADFTCLTFIDDSPPLQTWGRGNVVVDSKDESDRSSGRAVLGTATGDLYVFVQRGVRLVPREFAEAVRRGKGGDAVFLEPWWLFGPRHEVTTNKRLWDMGAELVETIPHSLEVANNCMLLERTKERLLALDRKIAITPQEPAALEELKRQRATLEYAGPVTGHEGGVTALSFNRESGKIVSAGANGEVVQWQAFFFLPPPPFLGPPPPALSTHNTAAEINLSHHEKDRDQSGPRLRRVAGTAEPSTSDDQPGAAADGVDMDYQTTLAREDDGEISLSGLLPCRKKEGRGGGEVRRNGAATTGQMPNAFEVGVGPAVEADSSAGKSEGKEGNDPAAPETERSRKEGASPDAGTGPRVEVRPDRETQDIGSARPLPLPQGSYCKSLAWSKDGERLLAGANTNALVVLKYPADDREASPDERAEAVSAHGGRQQPGGEDGSLVSDRSSPDSRKAEVTPLVRGHYGSVLALGVFEGLQEYATAGYDRSVTIWDADSTLPVALGHVPSPASCLACSPHLDEVVVGSANSNEIFFFRVHRRSFKLDDDCTDKPHDAKVGVEQSPSDSRGHGYSSSSSSWPVSNASGIELHRARTILPASLLAKRWQPAQNTRGAFSGIACGKIAPSKLLTLAGRDVGPGGGVAHGEGASGGGSAATIPLKPSASSNASPSRGLTRPGARDSGRFGFSSKRLRGHTRSKSLSDRAVGSGADTQNAGGMGLKEDEPNSRRGPRKFGGDSTKEQRRGLGASCMRYSPSGSHLAIGCKNGTLVIMAVETEGGDGTGGNIGKTRQEHIYLTEPSDRPLGQGEVLGSNHMKKEEGGGKEGEPREQQQSGAEERPRATKTSSIEGHMDNTVGAEQQQQPSWSPRQRAYRRVACLKGHSSRVLHLDWTVDGRFVHTCGQDYQVLHWEILPPPGNPAEGGGSGHDGGNLGADMPGEEFRPRLFQRAFLLRDEHWATWSTSIGWPVQGIFPAYSDNTEVNAVDVCPSRNLLATADDSKTIRLLRYPVLRGGARHKEYRAHSSHVLSARFTVGVEPMRLITIGGPDSSVMQWTVEGAS